MAVDLKQLSPPALRAAMTTGTDDWGVVGSAAVHALYIEEAPRSRRGRRICHCGCRKMKTHLVKANGVALSGGCELEARRALERLKRWSGNARLRAATDVLSK